MRRGEHGSRAFQAPVDVHASADGQVHMFKRRPNELSASSDDEELNLLEMTPRVYPEQEQDRLRNIHLLEREVMDGDSLNKLALQYGCKVIVTECLMIFVFYLLHVLKNMSLMSSFLSLSTGVGFKAGEQPHAGTRFLRTKIDQNTYSEAQLFNRDSHRADRPSGRDAMFI